MEHVLLSAGYGVDSVSNAASARKWLGLHAYDLVLADGKLGDGNGFEIADLGARQGAKVLIITGYAMAFRKADLERYPYLMKPVRPAELVKAIEDLIGGPEIPNSG